LALEASDHTVRVERNGYETPAAKQVKITAGARQTVVFSLNPQNARLELAGAPADLEVRVDGKPLGRTDGSASYVFPAPVPSGDHILTAGRGLLQGRQGSAGRTLSEHFDPGQPVRVSWKPEPAPPTPAPIIVRNVPPTPEEIQERDWEKVRGTADPAQLRDFRKKYPKAHAAEAESLLDRLAWSSTRKDSLESLRAYLHDFPSGAYVAQAEPLIADLAWKGVDQTKIEQVRKFLEENRKGPHALEAQRLIDLLKAQDAKLDLLRKQVLDALNTLDQAFERKQEAEVKKIWPRTPKLYLESLKTAGQRISLKPLEEPKLQGDTAATVRCTLHVELNIKDKDQPAIISLQYGGGRWLIADLKVVQ
jgi:hypothetical protein